MIFFWISYYYEDCQIGSQLFLRAYILVSRSFGNFSALDLIFNKLLVIFVRFSFYMRSVLIIFSSYILLSDQTLNSVQFSHSVLSNSLQPHEHQHARPLCPSPTPRVYSNSCPLSQWCHPAISSSVVPFSSCPQYLPASGSFPASQLFQWGGQSIGFSVQHQSFQGTLRTDLI